MPGLAARSTMCCWSKQTRRVLTAALLTPRPSAISVRDWTGGSESSSQAETRPGHARPAHLLIEKPELLDELALLR